jgi:hypothetical protein
VALPKADIIRMAKTTRLTCLVLALALVPALAQAQLPNYRPSTPAATGERYNVEFSVGMWNPTPDITIRSGKLTAIGTEINAVNDLGFAQKKLPDFHLVLRPAKKHKFRFEYLPIRYEAAAVLTRTITFHGITYTVGLPVTSSLDWKAYHLGYEYDFVYRSRGFVGVIAEVKYTQVQASVASQIASAAMQQTAPIPAIGAVARGYLTENVSITGELTGFKLPESISADTRGRYVDFDIYGTWNVSNNVGAQAGYRSLDAMYQVTEDSGTLKLRGVYVRGVVRF